MNYFIRSLRRVLYIARARCSSDWLSFFRSFDHSVRSPLEKMTGHADVTTRGSNGAHLINVDKSEDGQDDEGQIGGCCFLFFFLDYHQFTIIKKFSCGLRPKIDAAAHRETVHGILC